MAVVTFVSHDGEEHVVPLEEGQSLMRIAVNNAVPGIDADCGGEAASMNPERLPTSRLSCQMTASADWDGLTVQVPEFQM